jgi:hypothetical protein
MLPGLVKFPAKPLDLEEGPVMPDRHPEFPGRGIQLTLTIIYGH